MSAARSRVWRFGSRARAGSPEAMTPAPVTPTLPADAAPARAEPVEPASADTAPVETAPALADAARPPAPVAPVRAPAGPDPGRRKRPHRWRYRVLLALVLGGALGLRLWGVKQGLPYAYNTDENSHFVPYAIGMFVYGFRPGSLVSPYFVNPPGLTYILHFVFALWFGGRASVSHAFAVNPTSVFVVARVTVALLGTASVWLLYLAGARLFDRRVGLLAAALMGVAFLPVFYAHQALNDAVTPTFVALSLWGVGGMLRDGRWRHYLVAGVGIGLASAVKYTGGIAAVPVVIAAVLQLRPGPAGRRALAGLCFAGAAAVAAFLLANPYSVLDYSAFRYGIVHQSTVSEAAGGKLGAPKTGGVAYYLWSFTWGLGWVPSIAAAGGAIALWWDRPRRRLILVLALAPLLFLAFMGLQGRYFGRWLLPIFPMVCLLAAYFGVRIATLAARRRPLLRPTFVAIAAVALLGQGLVYSIHSGLILSRADTRNEARAWMVANIPVGSQIVLEPVVPDAWVTDPGHALTSTKTGARWVKYHSLVSVVDAGGSLDLAHPRAVNIEDYERTLSPALIPYYEQLGYCWVITGFDQAGRAAADPAAVPNAVAYYAALAREGHVVYQASPYYAGASPVAFNFDWTFDNYNLAYARPGPLMTVYRLDGGRCAAGVAGAGGSTTATAAATTTAIAGTASAAILSSPHGRHHRHRSRASRTSH